MPPSAELLAADEVMDELMPGNGEGERGIVAAERVEGSKAGDEEDEMDCLRTDLNASDVDAAMSVRVQERAKLPSDGRLVSQDAPVQGNCRVRVRSVSV